MSTVQVFRYIEELDAFLVTDEFKQLANTLGITEWHEVVWMGRLITLNNDYGEHWFDNWDEREALQEKALALGIDDFDLMIVVPDRFSHRIDNDIWPCHSPEVRKAFWTDVLKSLRLSYEMLFLHAREDNELTKIHQQQYPEMYSEGEGYIADLEERIDHIKRKAGL